VMGGETTDAKKQAPTPEIHRVKNFVPRHND
jgi:hypothetical protein